MTNYGVINKIKSYISSEVQVVLLSMKQQGYRKSIQTTSSLFWLIYFCHQETKLE